MVPRADGGSERFFVGPRPRRGSELRHRRGPNRGEQASRARRSDLARAGGALLGALIEDDPTGPTSHAREELPATGRSFRRPGGAFRHVRRASATKEELPTRTKSFRQPGGASDAHEELPATRRSFRRARRASSDREELPTRPKLLPPGRRASGAYEVPPTGPTIPPPVRSSSHPAEEHPARTMIPPPGRRASGAYEVPTTGSKLLSPGRRAPGAPEAPPTCPKKHPARPKLLPRAQKSGCSGFLVGGSRGPQPAEGRLSRRPHLGIDRGASQGRAPRQARVAWARGSVGGCVTRNCTGTSSASKPLGPSPGWS